MVFFAPSSATLKLVMKPSSFKIRAISVFSLEAGTSTLGWRAWIAFRTRVSMSAMGSLVIVLLLRIGTDASVPGRCGLRRVDRSVCPWFALAARLHLVLPAGLRHARNLAIQSELAEAQAADAELAQERARPAAAPATVPMPALQLRRLGLAGLFQLDVFRNFGGGGHLFSSPSQPGAVESAASTSSYLAIAGTASPSA